MCEKRKYPLLAAIFFAGTPAVTAGLVAGLLTHWFLGLLVAVVVFMFGMDVLLNSTDRRKMKRFEERQ